MSDIKEDIKKNVTPDEFKSLMKEAIKEYMKEQVAEFGLFAAKTISAAVFVSLLALYVMLYKK